MGEWINALTEKLFAEGYTIDNYPDYVNSYNNFYGGFEYKYEYRSQLVFSTPCGLLVCGDYFVNGTMSYNGTLYSVSNHNPEIRCPYGKVDCELNDENLKGIMYRNEYADFAYCACHLTDEPYSEERSLVRAYKQIEKDREEQFKTFKEKRKGHVCLNMCHYNERKGEWVQIYYPMRCDTMGCGFCTILNKRFSGKKGNVFYDLVTKAEVETGEGFLFERKIVTHKEKGKRFFKSPVAIEICEVIAKAFKNEVYDREKMKHSTDLFWAEQKGTFYEISVENIRAEQKESRDLKQDLIDIADGITVVHQSDVEAEKADKKRQAAQNRKEENKRKLLKAIEKKGSKGLSAVEKNRLGKALDRGQIESEEVKEAIQKSQTVQLSLFDDEEEGI